MNCLATPSQPACASAGTAIPSPVTWKGLGEVDLRLALGGDGERGHGQVERAVGDAVQQPVERRFPELIIIAQLPGDLIPELDTDPAPLALGALDREGRGILGADGEGAGGG